MPDTSSAPPHRPHLPFSVLAKPSGAACNLDCAYCFFLSKEVLYGREVQRMDQDRLERYLGAYFDAQPDGDVVVAWQGGEPTLRGLDFFRAAVAAGERLRRPGQRVTHAIQTNGTLLDDRWGEFLAANDVLVGISIDGPQELHDRYRVNKGGRGTHAQVERGWRVLQRYGVRANVLCTVNSANSAHALRVYRYFRDDLGARYLQFIPVVERVRVGMRDVAENGWRGADGHRVLYLQSGDDVTSRSVSAAGWGEFLVGVFDEWSVRDVGTVFVQHFETLLAALFGQYSLCVHAPTCGTALALEHNGDVYSCDHFVEPDYLLGNIAVQSFPEMLESERQRTFGRDKLTGLTAQCRTCPVRWACNGGCPKDRFATSVDGELGHNYLCEGYLRFFLHAEPLMRRIADLLATGRPASDVMVPEDGRA